LAHTPAKGQGIALHNVMHEVKEIGHTQALKALFGELDERLGPVTHQIQHAGAQGLQPLVHQGFPRGVGAIVCHLLLHHVASRHILEDQDHLCQKGFVHGPNNLTHLPTGDPVLFPSLRRLHNHVHPCLHDPA
jgi:hypothetical protein